jgi:CRISPR-associated protein (TIGR02584 family)
MGTSSAVLTETVWALAHSKEPVVPDEIEVITTASGKAAQKHLTNFKSTGCFMCIGSDKGEQRKVV